MHASTFNVRNLGDPDAISVYILTRTGCESETSKTMIVGIRKSDKIVVPEKQANNAVVDSSGVCGGKGLTERKVNEFDRDQTQNWVNTMSGLARVRGNAKKDKNQSFTSLMHHLTPALLRRSYDRLKRKAATGIDGVSWDDYQEKLENLLLDLHARVQKGSYKRKTARRVYIAKGGGEQRPLSILSLKDTIVQQAVVLLLNEIYETDFFGFSYGFRPGRSQHNALDALTFGISKKASSEEFVGRYWHCLSSKQPTNSSEEAKIAWL